MAVPAPARLSVMRRLAARLLVAALAGVVLSACEVRSELHVTVRDDGTGTVELALGLDAAAVASRPDLADALTVDDLVAAGWEVSGPESGTGGLTWLRVRHDFERPDDLGVLVDEIAGPDGPFRDFSLERDDAFARTEFRFEGTVDFTAGLDGLTEDAELAEALGEDPAELLRARLGRAVDEVVSVQVAVRLPGEVSSNAPTRAVNGAVWRPSVLEREAVQLRAAGTVTRNERYLWVGLAGLAGLAALLTVTVRVAAWSRRQREQSPDKNP